MLHRPDMPDARRIQGKFTEWLDRWTFSRFVTLQFNDRRQTRLGKDVPEAMRRALKHFDATINRELLKKHWAKHPDRIFAVWVPEKVSVSPHWHGLVRFYAETDARRTELEEHFDRIAKIHWLRIAPFGSFDMQVVDGQEGALKYIAKSLPYGVSYDHVVMPDEFSPR